MEGKKDGGKERGMQGKEKRDPVILYPEPTCHTVSVIHYLSLGSRPSVRVFIMRMRQTFKASLPEPRLHYLSHTVSLTNQ